jgi:2-polyprenyl-3-methyl-5-hydroxy-6-metoxy-1,4-benzoquinol methylase
MKNDICCICDGKTKKIDFKTNLSITSDARATQMPLEHYLCRVCGYIFVDINKRIDFTTFYSNDYEFLLEGMLEPATETGTYSEILADFFKEYISSYSGKKFFDIGAGKGTFIKAMHKIFPNLDYFALEPSKSYEILKKINFLKGSYNFFFNSSSFPEYYDYLSLIGVLEHVDNPKILLTQIKEIMHEESLLLIEVPNFQNNKSDLLTIDHISKFTEESITYLLKTLDFTIVDKRVSKMVPMQYIVKKEYKTANSTHYNIDFSDKAVKYLQKIIDDAKKIQDHDIAIYGQGLILDYLIYQGILSPDRIVCIVDDNNLYHGKMYKSYSIPIVNYEDLSQKYQDIRRIFLAMNDCYHEKVLDKLNGYEVYGLNMV